MALTVAEVDQVLGIWQSKVEVAQANIAANQKDLAVARGRVDTLKWVKDKLQQPEPTEAPADAE